MAAEPERASGHPLVLVRLVVAGEVDPCSPCWRRWPRKSEFAYVDQEGGEHLPIRDEAQE
jgi:hypothetical protein